MLTQCLESRRLLSVSITDASPATLADADGSEIRINIDGAGTATADVVRNRLELNFTGGNNASVLTIGVTSGDGRAIARALSFNSPIGAINADQLQLAGSLTGKSLGSVSLRSLSSASVRVGWLQALNARSISDSSISADRIGAITVAGDISNTRIYISPANDKPVALGSVAARGTLTGSMIFALGDIGAVTVGAMFDSTVTAGVRMLETQTSAGLRQPLPDKLFGDALYDFIGAYRIARVTVTGKLAGQVAFFNSVVGAYEIGEALLNKVSGISGVAEHGIAAYRFGKISRSYETTYASNDSLSNPGTAFQVRQISKAISFSPTTGSYTGSTIGGNTSVGAGTLTINPIGGNWNIGTMSTSIPVLGLQIGTASGTRGDSVYLTHGGRFELRDGSEVVLSAATLSAIAADLFRRSRTPIKLENTSGNVTIRTTSTGPAITLFSSMLGSRPLAAFDQSGTPVTAVTGNVYTGAGATIGGSNVIPLSAAKTLPRRIPSLVTLTTELKATSPSLQEFAKPLLLIQDGPLAVGHFAHPLSDREIGLDQSMEFVSGATHAGTVGELVSAASSDRIGSRRFAARWVANPDGSATVIGLPDGSTATIKSLGENALNSVGTVKKLPTARALHQSLLDNHLQLLP